MARDPSLYPPSPFATTVNKRMMMMMMTTWRRIRMTWKTMWTKMMMMKKKTKWFHGHLHRHHQFQVLHQTVQLVLQGSLITVKKMAQTKKYINMHASIQYPVFPSSVLPFLCSDFEGFGFRLFHEIWKTPPTPRPLFQITTKREKGNACLDRLQLSSLKGGWWIVPSTSDERYIVLEDPYDSLIHDW